MDPLSARFLLGLLLSCGPLACTQKGSPAGAAGAGAASSAGGGASGAKQLPN